ncbi:MAG: hypothetical protein BGO63_15400 [Candidatus Accumulibacter sp. 66-26]|nr:MAG: hypothetical protein BGO63_15400 [Candidatus Accumulibacter sp. 66-26]
MRIGSKTPLAGKPQAGTTQLHADTSLAAGGIQLAAVARNIPGESAQFIGIKASNPLDPAAQCLVEHGGNHLLLAVLGKKGDFLTCIGIQLDLGSSLGIVHQLLRFCMATPASFNQHGGATADFEPGSVFPATGWHG